jgi:zinc/manganese transport system permease protein
LGAALFSFLWDRNHSVLQEAFIGIAFSLATAGTLLLLANAPHGAEHVQGTLSGEALGWVAWKDVGIMAVFYALVGAFLYIKRETLHLCSTDTKKAQRQGLSLKLWDFLFYTAFGLVVTDAVRVAGVLAVFSFLIVPVVCATLMGHKGKDRLLWAWGIGLVVSALGSVLSYAKDWPMGATIVCFFGLAVIIISVTTRMKNAD